jgi:hypothetical protein
MSKDKAAMREAHKAVSWYVQLLLACLQETDDGPDAMAAADLLFEQFPQKSDLSMFRRSLTQEPAL